MNCLCEMKKFLIFCVVILLVGCGEYCDCDDLDAVITGKFVSYSWGNPIYKIRFNRECCDNYIPDSMPTKEEYDQAVIGHTLRQWREEIGDIVTEEEVSNE